MTDTTPAESLLYLEENPTEYRALVERLGFSLACYQIAEWRIAAAGWGKPVPTKSDLVVAARTLKRRLDLAVVPSGKTLAADCRLAGKKVI